MTKKQASQQKQQQGRKSKFYDEPLNQRLRALMDEHNTRSEDFAIAVGITSSAVRMWHGGYARPDIEKIPAICQFFGVSADYLLGLSDVPSVDIETRDICEKTGLNHNAMLNLLRIAKGAAEGDSFFSPATSQEMLWFVNTLLEDVDLSVRLANSANTYVQIRDAVDEPLGESVDDGTVIKLMKMGLEKFGPTFNFTVGRETAENLLFLCQRYLTELLENVQLPAYPMGYADKSDEDVTK